MNKSSRGTSTGRPDGCAKAAAGESTSTNKRRNTTDGIAHNSMANDEQNLAQIKEIFHLLVMQHSNYSNFIIKEEGDWVWAQKIQQETKTIHNTTSKTVATITNKNNPHAIGYSHCTENANTKTNTTTATAKYKRLVKNSEVNMYLIKMIRVE